MTARTLSFTGPRSLEVRRRPIPDPGPGELRVRTETSAISAGTEGLLYRGEAPTTLPADESLDALEGDLSYPLAYGYAAVGVVTAVGEGVDDALLDRRVFAYNPHESHFLARPDDLLPVPESVSAREAALFANLESAITFSLDGDPTLGERVVVFGQGVVGLLTTALLAESPLETLVTVDHHASRRELSREFGADRSLDPERDVAGELEDLSGSRADLSYELSGNPEALNDAIAATGFDGRIVVGSWYGEKSAPLELGGRFHRDRIDVHSSQVSTIAPRLEGRWSRERRHELTWEWLSRLDLEGLFTHEFPLERAEEAYRSLEERPDEAIQVFLTYR